MKTRVIGYCRVSTDNQAREQTISIQTETIKDYCHTKRYDLLKTFKDDGQSGSNGLENRLGLAEMFDFLEENKEVKYLIIWKLDRLARDLYLQEHLIRKLESLNIKLISIHEPDLLSDDPTRILMRQILGSFSQFEKSLIVLRMTAGRLRKASKSGYAGGGPAYGYMAKDRELVVDKEQARIIKLIFKLKKKMGLREIARYLNDKQIPTARGGKWHARTIKYILENKKYKGKYSYKSNKYKRLDLKIV